MHIDWDWMKSALHSAWESVYAVGLVVAEHAASAAYTVFDAMDQFAFNLTYPEPEWIVDPESGEILALSLFYRMDNARYQIFHKALRGVLPGRRSRILGARLVSEGHALNCKAALVEVAGAFGDFHGQTITPYDLVRSILKKEERGSSLSVSEWKDLGKLEVIVTRKNGAQAAADQHPKWDTLTFGMLDPIVLDGKAD